jgi:Ca2+-binding EF-hand superfamily protein
MDEGVPPGRLRSSTEQSGASSSMSLSPARDESTDQSSLSPQREHTPTDRERLVAMLTKRGKGRFLRGWRRDLDPDGSFDINFMDFCSAAQRIGWNGDARELFGRDLNPKYLNLEELEPDKGALMHRFRDWVRDSFGGPVEMYSAFDVAGRTRLTYEMFVSSCRKHGFTCEPEQYQEIFACCDVSDSGTVSQEEIIFLENEKSLRELAMFKAKKSQKEKHLKLMCWAYREDGLRALSPTHRLAQRPWLAENFEQLPMLVHHRRVEWQRETHRRGLEARITFVRHLRDTYSNEVRAWRNGLDPTGKFELTAKDIRSYCRKHDLKLDSGDLWKSLDKDCDGFFRLEELCVGAADILASFQHWAVQSFGSTAAIWDRDEMVDARSKVSGHWASEKKVLTTTFTEVLRDLEWPAFNDQGARQLLLSSLDIYGCSFISCSDLEWLDKWRMPEWLCAEPDYTAWEELRAMIMHYYKHPLKAWRLLLDTDNSNNVSWLEFKEACERIRFKGNIGGAWRALNERLASSISMKEYDSASAELLSSFKEWAETNFGTVKLAFKAIDVNNTGKLSYQELKRACQNLKWQGEVRLLFDCLDLDGKLEGGKRFISMKEVQFLDEWEGDPGLEEQAEDEIVNAAVQQLRTSRTPTRASSASSSLPSLPSNRRPVSNASKASAVGSSSAAMAVTTAEGGYPSIARSSNSAPVIGGKGYLAAARANQKERLQRTYRCSQRPQSLQKSRSLPWLKRIINIDDKMKSY